MAFTLLDLLNAIKEESRVDMGNDLDVMITRIINEVMVKHTRNKEYPDLYMVNVAVAIASNGQSNFPLPADFTKIKEMRFSIDGTNFRYVKQRNQFPMPFGTGYPSWWWVAGSRIYVNPYANILTTHTLVLDYLRLPVPLVNPTDELEVDDLYPIIVNEAMARVAKYHDQFEKSDRFQRDAVQAETTVEE